ncbi:gfo/Idh/MocA family oxidoreductase [Alteromonas sediminis]|uniref:Gfo/Idh/MocA family oxidoreductase n=1 Tax=Alteromonas sediminis TaxID=2259342 RepID=A0A3N5Y391_9ALTE|nr:Gfo/Idh/MocA family oxidoreductase [Alteromonas sediminis]RPJ67226.1 gfo/Idh/MocA family oxidoreductase [Alteromonas sediminis]
MVENIRWGIVGAGRIAHTFTSDIRFAEHATLKAVAAREMPRALAFSQQYGDIKAYADYQALFSAPDIDAIYIATPHAMHFEQVKAAMEEGKAVLCEKPITVSYGQCEALAALSKSSQCFLMEAMWTYLLPAIQQAQQWVKEGRIGDIRQIQADFGYAFPFNPQQREWNTELGGGCLREMGVYPLAFNRLFMKSEPLNITASVHRAENGADAHVVALMDYGSVVSVMGASFVSKLRNWAYVIGTEGYIAIPDFWRATEITLFKGDECIETFSFPMKGSGFEYQIEHASNAIIAGKRESDIVSHSDSLAVQHHMDQILSMA